MGPAKESMDTRDSWDIYFLKIAHQVATRATCDRKHVGCVITKHRAILATGYNGSIRGMAHCDDAGHMMRDSHCVRTLHAEANALVQAARNGVRVEGATLYSTAFPCWECFKLVTNSGVREIVYDEPYREGDTYTLTSQICYSLGITFRQVEVST
jgi:dCMP deaminase